MADERNKNKYRNVDDAGIRLAPTPIRNSDYHVLPSIRQEFVIEPSMQIDEPKDAPKLDYSTADDFQPKVKDKSKKWKRTKRGKNIVFGVIMLVITILIVLPYILAVAGQTVGMPFKYVPEELNAIGGIVNAIKTSIANRWAGPEVNSAWLHAVPSLVLCVGLFFVVINGIKSLFAILGAVKPVRYMVCSAIYLVCVLAVLVLYLIGVNAIGVSQINFVEDVIKSCSTSEIFALTVLALGNLFVSIICTLFNKDKLGYIG
ncbi:MAG: hypothetical protein J5713_03030 [Clostridia bacterium]|nr:hypothetical protein [Clostridia bacterium]